MSVITSFYNTTAIPVRRATATPTSSDTVTTMTAVVGLLWPVTNVSKLFIENNIGNEFNFICDDASDIKVGDALYIGGIKYGVLGIPVYTDLEDGSDSHKSVRVAK